MTQEEIKESKETQASLYYQQYLAAEGQHKYAEALEFIDKQQEVLKSLHGDTPTTRICSNLYIRSKMLMHCSRLKESYESMQEAFEMRDKVVD